MTAHLLPTVPPFDLRLSLLTLSGRKTVQGEQATSSELRKATRLNGQTVGFVIRQEEEGLSCTLHPERSLSQAETAALLHRLAFFLAPQDDVRPFYERADQDAAFGPALAAIRGFHQPRFLTPFEVACWAVLTQRLPNAQALKLKRALTAWAGGEWEGFPAFPEPADLAGLSAMGFQDLVGNECKAYTLLAVTQTFAKVSEAELHGRSTSDLQEWLLGMYGIGDWSALFILVRGPGRRELLDVGATNSPLSKELMRAAQPVYGELTPGKLARIAAGYGDQQGQWATYLRSRVHG